MDQKTYIKYLIDKNSEDAKFFGPGSYPSDELIKKTEEVLGIKLPQSYLWFLRKFGGGEIGYEEVYSIWAKEFNFENIDDLASAHLRSIKNGLAIKGFVEFSSGEFGEGYYFDCRDKKVGEFQIVQGIGVEAEDLAFYAENFYGFLINRICDLTYDDPDGYDE